MTKTKLVGEQTTFSTKIDIKPDARKELIDILNQQLADTADLYAQTKQAHWNVKGMEFQQLHELFDKVAAKVEPFVDTIAERVTTLGGVAMGTVRMAAANSTLPEYPMVVDGRAHLEAVVDRFAAYAASNRAALRRSGDLDDPTTEDMFTEISREIDLSLYFLEAHLQG
ncbi:MAG: DNA starvation/stationary phase protection protein Dps [Trueperaceae bacterium]